MTVLVILS